MSFIQVGDLAQHLMMRRQNTLLKTQMNTLTQELASGRKSDIASAVSADFSVLGDIEHTLTVLDGHAMALKDARLFTDTVQNVLEQVQTQSQALGTSLLSVMSAGLEEPINSTIGKARESFDAIVSNVNAQVAGRGLFSGAATQSAALAGADAMLSDLSTALAGALTVSDIVNTVDQWFMAPGGGFETMGYQGAAESLAPFKLGEHETVRHELTADSMELRTLLRDTALAALAGDSGLSLDLSQKKQLLKVAGEGLLTQQEGLTRIRSDLGFVQERIANIETQNAARRTSLQITRNTLTSADPFETATQLEAAQAQLETLYTVTARLSRLSLMDYLR